jgi:hypothetical protein
MAVSALRGHPLAGDDQPGRARQPAQQTGTVSIPGTPGENQEHRLAGLVGVGRTQAAADGGNEGRMAAAQGLEGLFLTPGASCAQQFGIVSDRRHLGEEPLYLHMSAHGAV